MRLKIKIVSRRDGGHEEHGEGVLWVDEIPPMLLRGKDKAGKRRQGKRDRVFTERKPKAKKSVGRGYESGMG